MGCVLAGGLPWHNPACMVYQVVQVKELIPMCYNSKDGSLLGYHPHPRNSRTDKLFSGVILNHGMHSMTPNYSPIFVLCVI